MVVDHADGYAERRELLAELARLPARQRSVLVLRYYCGLSDTEIADELGITHSAVSQQRTEAVRLLRDALVAHYADDEAAEFVPVSKTAPARRSAYLSRVATNAAVGIARAMREPAADGFSAAV